MKPRIWVGTRKGVFTLEPRGNRWEVTRTAFLGDHCPMLLPHPHDGSVFVALDHGHFGGKLHRSRDGGHSWGETAVPTYPPKPANEDATLSPDTKPIPWRLEKIWSLEAGHASEPGVLWCGTIPGGLFRSTDCGASWQLVESLWNDPRRKQWFGGGADYPGIHSICVDPRDGKHVVIGVSCGGVWETRDAGDTWELGGKGLWAAYMPPDLKSDLVIQDVHRIVACRAQPDCLWTQHHNGVFYSADSGSTWEDIQTVQPSVFGFAVAVHPHNPKIAWTIPAIKDERRIPVAGQVVVARTRDGGESFEVLRRGLPQEHAYDITFRHGLDIDSTGNLLAFGSTTGSLWISENQGDSWQCASEHLPPIYCVRIEDEKS